MYPEDISNISNYFSISPKRFASSFCRSQELLINDHTTLTVYYLDNKNVCNFLTSDNLCSINEVKPLQCKYGPESYFSSIQTWQNCIQYKSYKSNPFQGAEIPDSIFINKLLKGYIF